MLPLGGDSPVTYQGRVGRLARGHPGQSVASTPAPPPGAGVGVGLYWDAPLRVSPGVVSGADSSRGPASLADATCAALWFPCRNGASSLATICVNWSKQKLGPAAFSDANSGLLARGGQRGFVTFHTILLSLPS